MNGMDALEERLAAAGRTVAEDPGVRAALAELAAAGARRARHRRPLAIGLGVGALLALGGAGVAVAAGPLAAALRRPVDFAYSREWFDERGASLGTCRTDFRIPADLDAERRDRVLAYLEGLGLETAQPSAEGLARATAMGTATTEAETRQLALDHDAVRRIPEAMSWGTLPHGADAVTEVTVACVGDREGR